MTLTAERPSEAAAWIAPAIAARADEIEAGRRLPPDVAQIIARAGLYRMIVPKSLGGAETDPAEMARAIEIVAQADASAGWCVMIAATTGLLGAYLPKAHARAVFGDPLAITGGVFAPLGKAVRENGHWRVSGRWKWASGSLNCAWLAGGAMLYENGERALGPDGAPAHRMMVFPAQEVELIDTWKVAGLSGTGSVDMAAADVMVPSDRSVSLIHDRPVEDGPVYAFPAFGLLSIGIAAVALGNARAALDDLSTLAGAKKSGSRALSERTAVQASFAQAEARLRAARALLFETVEAGFEEAARTGALGAEQRALIRLAATHAARESAEATRIAYDLAGGSAVFLESPIQRRFRDAHVATQHIMVQPATLELAGRALLGLEGRDPTF